MFFLRLKGQCHEIFDSFFSFFKDSTWAPYEQAKTVSRTSSFAVHVEKEDEDAPVIGELLLRGRGITLK